MRKYNEFCLKCGLPRAIANVVYFLHRCVKVVVLLSLICLAITLFINYQGDTNISLRVNAILIYIP